MMTSIAQMAWAPTELYQSTETIVLLALLGANLLALRRLRKAVQRLHRELLRERTPQLHPVYHSEASNVISAAEAFTREAARRRHLGYGL